MRLLDALTRLVLLKGQIVSCEFYPSQAHGVDAATAKFIFARHVIFDIPANSLLRILWLCRLLSRIPPVRLLTVPCAAREL